MTDDRRPTTGNAFEAVIGLEVHAQLLTQSKLFCGCPTTFGKAPNSNICPVCTGQPGALPVLNRRAVEYAMRAGLALHCGIAELSVFARKNYFYPDLPKGYQISQFELPLCTAGHLDCVHEGTTKRITIQRIHMEEDAGKLLHDFGSVDHSHVDLNRSSVPLIEIVSGPDLRTPEEATTYLKTLRNILMYLGICDGNMQEGSLRCDANISVRRSSDAPLGTRTELKNLNSFRFVEKAIYYEIDRQIEVIEAGEKVIQETRLWNEKSNKTESMRGKEEAHDYRYFPDPDLLPLRVDAQWINAIRSELPELAEAKVARYVSTFGLKEYDARVLTQEKSLAEYFEAAVTMHHAPTLLANWITTELMGRMHADNCGLANIKITPGHLGQLIGLIEAGTISGKIAKTVFEEMYASGKDPEAIVNAKGLVQMSDASQLEGIIDSILAANAKNVAAFKAGKQQVLGFFVGQIMKETKGQANPRLVNELLRKKLS